MNVKSIVLGGLALVCLSGCAEQMLSDGRIRSNTALALNIPEGDIAIQGRRSDGFTNTYYTAKTRRGSYECVINGGGLMAAGLVNPPACHR